MEEFKINKNQKATDTATIKGKCCVYSFFIIIVVTVMVVVVVVVHY